MFAVVLVESCCSELNSVWHVADTILDAEAWALGHDYMVPDGYMMRVVEVGIPEFWVDNGPIEGVTVNGAETTRVEW